MFNKIARVIYCIAIVATLALAMIPRFSVAHADENVSFQVNVEESLSVAITTPAEWASGDVNEFLRNKVSINVATNSTSGFTASMYSANNTTNLTNTSASSIVLPTLATGSTRSAFPANYWGYSLGAYFLDGVNQGTSYILNDKTYGETESGVGSSNYYPLVSTSANPIKIMDGATSAKSSGSQEIYFGAKANASKASGTYTGTVVISVVTGTIDSTNPITPTNPVTPTTDTTPNDNQATYTGYNTTIGNTTHGATAYTTTSSTSSTETTTTQISSGDTTTQYPLGVTENSFSNNVSHNNSDLATGLAIVASVAATSGVFFAIAARRNSDDDEEQQ